MRLQVLTIVVISLLPVLTSANTLPVDDTNFAKILAIVGSKLIGNHPLFKRTPVNDVCFNHTKTYVQHILKGSYWALQMMDSSAKVPESMMMGLTANLGNFDQCVYRVSVPPEVGHFKGQYCLVVFSIPGSAFPDSLLKSAYDNTFGTKKDQTAKTAEDIEKMFHEVRGKTTVKLMVMLAYCIPSTCSAKDFEEGLNNLIAAALPRVPLSAKVVQSACYIEDGISLDVADLAAMLLLILIGALIACSTAYDLLKQEKEGENRTLMKSFSLYTNCKKLLRTQSSDAALKCLDGIRFLSTCWVILGHRLIIDLALPSVNLTDIFPPWLEDWKNYYLVNVTLSVDTFLILNGFLLSYTSLNHMKNTSSFPVIHYYVYRIIRLIPTYALIILLQATLLRFVGSGPLIKPAHLFLSQDCRRNWWSNLLFLNNYIKADSVCVGQSWYLALEFQLYLLFPLILCLLRKWPHGWNLSVLSTLVAAGIISPFLTSYVNKISANFLINMFTPTDYMKKLYFATHTHFGPWIIGVTLGYILFKTGSGKMNLTKLQVFLFWFVGLAALVGSLEGAYPFYQLNETKSVLANALYNGLFRNVWAFGVGILIFMCTSGYGGPVNTFLSSNIFHTLSNLTYCAYLVHLSVQVTISACRRTPGYISYLTLYTNYFADVIIIFTMAAVLYLCVELPTSNIRNSLIKKKEDIKKQR